MLALQEWHVVQGLTFLVEITLYVNLDDGSSEKQNQQ